VWSRTDMTTALAARDVAAVFGLAQQYSGITQARLGVATGLGQGRVNEIANGRRRITSIDVLARVADGLSMPDHARLALGLAPARPGVTVPQPRNGVTAAWASQASAAAEIRNAAWKATAVDVLAVRALGLLALNDSLLREPLAAAREVPVTVRILLLDPESETAARRAEEIGEAPSSFSAGISMAIARIRELGDLDHLDVAAAVYTQLPVWRIIRTDNTVYLSVFDHAAEGHQSEVHRLTGGLLHAGFTRQFEDVWTCARRVL
jgi:transcriptional regulator with XRE-family HTH domain